MRAIIINKNGDDYYFHRTNLKNAKELTVELLLASLRTPQYIVNYKLVNNLFITLSFVGQVTLVGIYFTLAEPAGGDHPPSSFFLT